MIRHSPATPRPKRNRKSSTEDFAYVAFTNQIQAMMDAPGGIFIDADNENDGNLAYRVQEGNAHDRNAALQYIYNGLLWLWAEGDKVSGYYYVITIQIYYKENRGKQDENFIYQRKSE